MKKHSFNFIILFALTAIYSNLYPMMQIPTTLAKNSILAQMGKYLPTHTQARPKALESYQINPNIKNVSQLAYKIDQKLHSIDTKARIPLAHPTGMFRTSQILYNPKNTSHAENTENTENAENAHNAEIKNELRQILSIGSIFVGAIIFGNNDREKFKKAGGKIFNISRHYSILNPNCPDATKCPKLKSIIWDYIFDNYKGITPGTHKIYKIEKTMTPCGRSEKVWTGEYTVFILPIKNNYEKQ